MSRSSAPIPVTSFGLFSSLRCTAGWSVLIAFLFAMMAPVSASAQTPSTYSLRVLSSDFELLESVAVDGHGNVYAVDGAKQLAEEYLAVNGVVPTNPTVRTLGSGFTSPRSIAVDKAGDVFVADYSDITELVAVNGSVPANPTMITVFSMTGTAQLTNLRFDGLGNLDFGIFGNNGDVIVQLAAVNGLIPANATLSTLFTGSVGHLGSFAADSKGDLLYLYFDNFDTAVYELVAVNGVIPANATPQKLLVEGDPPSFADFAVDAKGNMFIAEIVSAQTCALVEVLAVNGVIPANPTVTTLYSAPQATFRANNIALDAKDNMFITDFYDTDNEQSPISWELAEVSPATATAGVTLTPSTYNYGSVDVSSSANETFTLSNTGSAAVNIASTALSNKLFTIASTTCTSSLAAASSCTYKVEFAPIAVGAQTATFSVTDDGGTQTAALSGTGAAVTVPTEPAAALSPATQDFGSETVGSSSAAKTFTLANAGTATLPITSVAITGTNASSFTLGTNGCGSTLAAGASCTISISFDPGAAGSDSASLTVIDSVGTQTSALTGNGAAVVTPDFAIAATPATQTIAAGGTADYTVNLTPTGGFDSAVALTATGLPPGGTVTFSPASVTPNGTAVSSTMAIHVASLTTIGANTSGDNTPWKLGGSALAAVFLFLPFRRLRKWRGMLCALVFSATLLAMGGCGGGFGLGSSSTSATYTVKVTGTSGALTHSTTVQITVQTAAQSTQTAAE